MGAWRTDPTMPRTSSTLLVGIAGLSLVGEPGLQSVDPVFALNIAVTKRPGIYRGDGVEW